MKTFLMLQIKQQSTTDKKTFHQQIANTQRAMVDSFKKQTEKDRAKAQQMTQLGLGLQQIQNAGKKAQESSARSCRSSTR